MCAEDAGRLRCPGCGSNVEPDASRCPYCQARLATISCPSCFARVFDGTAFCPHCGAQQARGEAIPDSAACPGCGEPLHRVEIGTTPLFECGACDGVWVDAEVFEALCADRDAQPRVLHHLAERRPVAAAAVRYRPCVRCGKMMNRVNFGRMSGTIVDVCRGHGTFLDGGELHAILTFIQGGGLDAARARELQELKDERRRLEVERMRTRMPRGDGQGFEAEARWDATSIVDLLKRIARSGQG
jgi:Zn-finger nucleic acid-binding protein